MHRILIVFSTSRYSQELVEHALKEAEGARERGEDVEIRVTYIIEANELEKVYHSVGAVGFLGAKTQKEVLDTLAREHHRTARRRVGEAADSAREKGFSVTTTEVEGDFSKVVYELAKEDYQVLFLTRADRPFISRFLFGSECDRVARLVRQEGLGEVIVEDG